jgi:hypothetical protein
VLLSTVPFVVYVNGVKLGFFYDVHLGISTTKQFRFTRMHKIVIAHMIERIIIIIISIFF